MRHGTSVLASTMLAGALRRLLEILSGKHSDSLLRRLERARITTERFNLLSYGRFFDSFWR
jgi:hypothetical protein